MKVGAQHYRSIWYDTEEACVKIIDQRWLPHEFRIVDLKSREDFAIAIRDMWVRGAPLIGATAAFAVSEQMKNNPSNASLNETWDVLHETRPTAINLRWALDQMRTLLEDVPEEKRAEIAHKRALEINDEDVECNRQIGLHGLEIIKKLLPAKNRANRLISSPTVMRAGWRPLTGARRPPPCIMRWKRA